MPIQLDALDQAKSTLIDLAIKFGPKVIVALLIIAAGVYASRWVGAIFNKWLGKLTLEPPKNATIDSNTVHCVAMSRLDRMSQSENSTMLAARLLPAEHAPAERK